MKQLTQIGFLSFLTIIQLTANAQTQLGQDIDGEADSDYSGKRVSTSADGLTVAIGATHNDGNGADAGHVRVYKYDGATWSQQGSDIDGEVAGDQSGGSVSLSADGSIVAIGAIYNDVASTFSNKNDAGHVRIYELISGTWTQLGTWIGAIVNGDGDINGESIGDYSGGSVSLSADGSTVAIGAVYYIGTNVHAGHVRVYKYNGTTWSQQGSDIEGEAESDYSGWSVSTSADGLTVAIGAPYNDGNGADAGHVRVYKYDGATWSQQGSDIDGEVAGDLSGGSVSLSAEGSTVAIGATENKDNGDNAGHVRLYKYDGTAWIKQGLDIDGEAASDKSGGAVSLSADGSTVAIGAINNSAYAGHVRVYQFCTYPGVPTPTASVNNVLCGTNVTLDWSGAALNDATAWHIYTDFCGGTQLNTTTSNSLVVIPTVTTTYYIRGEDGNGCVDASTGNCDSITVTVESITNQTVTASSGTICSGASTMINLVSSEPSINYYLRDNDNNTIVDGPIVGTGDGISLNTGNLNATKTYNVYATNTPGPALDFDGSNNFVEVSNSASVGGPNDGTIEAWIKVPLSGAGDNYRGIMVKSGSYGIYLKSNELVAFKWSTGFAWDTPDMDYFSNVDLDDNQWHHIAFTFKNGIVDGSFLYIDGVKLDGSYTWSPATNENSLIIGAGGISGNIEQFNGTIGEVRVWNTARTSTEIFSNYQTCLTGSEDGLEVLYQFSEGTGTSLADATGNGHNGTLNNIDGNTDWVAGISSCPNCETEMTDTVTVTITVIDTSTITTGIDINANQTGATYQWIDCSNNTDMVGETSQAFTATANGSYKVAITKNGCTDTSACVSIGTVGLVENSLQDAFTVYPNPTKGDFVIEFEKVQASLYVKLLSVTGQLLKSKNIINSSRVNLSIGQPAGMYFLEVKDTNNQKAILKIIKN
ncbi:MAG: T9SS type A sorting domain-containing protein [Flavobacteriales bacterium]|nr:T9SS type A sorting domain-containing protein [Flavobacteriales bacterium]